MNNLGGLLAKFNNLLKTSRDSKKTVVECLTKITGIEFEEKDIELKGDTLYLLTHPSIKNEVFMRRNMILAELKILLDKRAPREIR
jgi:hypothetical protein